MIGNYYEDSDGGNFLEVDIKYSEKLYELHNNDLPFLLEKIKIGNVEKLVSRVPCIAYTDDLCLK